ncbi:TPA: membrane integrity-associated transporter subunit PqiC [Klebsiella michiganensis]|nr:membrane integrity-associated transporter subunit PqiC [Klebsiella michiganensis]
MNFIREFKIMISFFTMQTMCAGCLMMAMALLSACGSSPPVRYYTLMDAAEGGGKTTSVREVPSARAEFVLQILPVKIPASIDVPQLVLRNGQGEMVILDDERWLGPVGEEFRSALVSQLTRTLGTVQVSSLTATQKLPVYRIQINITRFDTLRGRYVLQDIDWSLRQITAEADQQEPERMLICASRQVVRPEDDSVAALVSAHQAALHRLGGMIVQTVRLPVWHCP